MQHLDLSTTHATIWRRFTPWCSKLQRAASTVAYGTELHVIVEASTGKHVIAKRA